MSKEPENLVVNAVYIDCDLNNPQRPDMKDVKLLLDKIYAQFPHFKKKYERMKVWIISEAVRTVAFPKDGEQ